MGLVTQDFVIDAFGARWGLDTAALTPEEGERLRVLWERCRIPGAGSADDGVEPFVVTSSDPYAVSRAITLASIGRRRGSAVLLHAAGLSDGDRAIALVGPSGTGKSTAARALGQHFGYLSDETVAIEPDGRISPYPKPVSTIDDPTKPWAKSESSPDELGLRKARDPAYLHALVVLERDPAHTVPELVHLPLADAVLAVIKETSSQPIVERPLHRLAHLVSLSGGPYLLRYSEIDQCLELLRGLFTTDHDDTVADWSSTPGPIRGDDRDRLVESQPEAEADVEDSSVVTRGPWRDAVHGEDGSVVLINNTPVRLGPIGEVIWDCALEPLSVADARAAVVESLGDHPDAGSLVQQGIADMLASGVLRPAT